MVLRGDRNRINIVTGQQFPEITVHLAVTVLEICIDNGLGLVAACFNHIANSHNLDTLSVHQRFHITFAHRTYTHGTKCHPIAGRDLSVLTEY